MKVRRVQRDGELGVTFELLDTANQPVEVVSDFMRHLTARGSSPNTLSAYAYDLLRFMTYLDQHQLSYETFTPSHAWTFLEYLREIPSRTRPQRLGLVLCTTDAAGSRTYLSPTTINRTLAAVSSFYEFLIVSGHMGEKENPIQRVDDLVLSRVAERHRPFMGHASRQRPIRRAVRVKTVQRLPRPMDEEQVSGLLASFQRKRDKALLLLMLHGGLRPGEALNLQLEDISYARKRVVIRYRNAHPKGARSKSRTERVVDLLQPETLQALSEYIMSERPTNADTPYVFLVGGGGKRRCEPLGYHALVKMFARHCERLGIREPWVTPHALRHTHATRLWEGGMRELALQKRLGHASPESTRMYTRVSDAAIVEEYRRALGEKAPE